MIKKMAMIAVAVSVAGTSTSLVRADSVSLDTYQGSSWTVQRVTIGGESDPTTGTFAVQEVTNNPGWSSLSDPNAQWVSWNSNTGTGYTGDVNGTQYIYTDTFTLGDLTGANDLTLAGSFLTDNYATGVTLTANGNPVSVTLTPDDPLSVLPPNPTEFGYHYAVDVSALDGFVGNEQFVLTVTTVNSYADPANLSAGTNPGPTGFEFSGVAASSVDKGGDAPPAVPTPEAAWMGMSLLGGIGGLKVFRKRLLGV
jgi:hypothetical protein